MATLEEIQKRRAERRESQDKARDAQEAIDLAAIDELEETGGEPLHTMTVNVFKQGAPVRIAYRTPSKLEYKRYSDMVGRSAQKPTPGGMVEAAEMLGKSCLVYPPAESAARTAALEAFGGLLVSVGMDAVKRAEMRSDAEGKG